MGTHRKQLTPSLSTEWARMGHPLRLNALMSQSDWATGALPFTGEWDPMTIPANR